MSSMKRRIFMRKANIGNSNVLKIVSIMAAIIVSVSIISKYITP